MIKKVKFVRECFLPNSGKKDDLTINKIYDVIQYRSSNTPFYDNIKILDDNGIELQFFLSSSEEEVYFVDATSEFRNEVIESILE